MKTGYPFLDGASVLAFAHRGGAAHPDLTGRENTRAAFAHAVALGYRHLETDVHATRDGVLVAFHDRALERLTDTDGSIEDLTWAEVSRLRVGGSEPVPTLEELVVAFPDVRFNVDLKSGAAVGALARFVAEHQFEDRILVGSFSHRRISRFRRLAGPRVPTAASPVEVAAYLLLPGWLARRIASRPAALQVPHRRGFVIVSEGLVRRAHAAGLPVHVWTVDDPEEMRVLLDRGVDGLMTDRTDILREVLRTRGSWPEENLER